MAAACFQGCCPKKGLETTVTLYIMPRQAAPAQLVVSFNATSTLPFGISLKQYPEVHPGLLVLPFRVGHLVVTELSQSVFIHCLLKGLRSANQFVLCGYMGHSDNTGIHMLASLALSGRILEGDQAVAEAKGYSCWPLQPSWSPLQRCDWACSRATSTSFVCHPEMHMVSTTCTVGIGLSCMPARLLASTEAHVQRAALTC